MNTTEEKPANLASLPPRSFTLRLVYSGDTVIDPPAIFTTTSGLLAIGREAKTGIALPRDRRASRLHAKVHIGPLGLLHIIDEGSRNGILRNGQRVGEAILHDGDVLTIGDSHFIIRAEPIGLGDVAIASLPGTSPAMRSVRGALQRVAPTEAAVLLLGESGTGKEDAAQVLYAHSGRLGPFIPIHCSTLAIEDLPTLLMGHGNELGTGKESGTLFFDELADLALSVQLRLLAALPLGVRIIAASCRDLVAAVKNGTLRADLYARVADVVIKLPPLRERKEDLLPLLMQALGPPEPQLGSRLVERLLLHDWPFNLREVSAIASQLRIWSKGAKCLELEHLGDRLSPVSAAAFTDPAEKDVPQAPRSPAASANSPTTFEQFPAPNLIKEGEVWCLTFGKEILRLKDAKGMRYLEQLLQHPEQEIHVMQLIALGMGPDEESLDAGERRAAGLKISDGGDAGAMLDDKAKAAYHRRLTDLRDGLEEATRFGDRTRAARIKHEIEALAQQLAQAVGLSGRDRKSAAAAERARINVQRRLRDVLTRIAQMNPILGRYLNASLRTGTYCSYEPTRSIG